MGLHQQRHEAARDMRMILDKAKAENRDLTVEESERWNSLDARVTDIDRELRTGQLGGDGSGDDAPLTAGELSALGSGVGASRSYQRGQLLGREQRAADAFAALGATRTDDDRDGLSLGDLIRGRFGLGDSRALSEGVDAQGGFLTPELLASRLVDRVRARSQVLAAGAQTLPLDSDKVSLPRLVGGVTGTWRGELTAVTEETPSFDRVTFQPKSIATFVRLSYELVEDMIEGSGALIENELLKGLALSIDAAALRGTGGLQPLGIRNQPGVAVQSLGANGATPTYAHLMAAITTLLTANMPADKLSAIMAPRVSQTLRGINDTTGQPIVPAQPIQDLDWLVSGNVPVNLVQGTSNDASPVTVGDFSNLVIGFKPWLRIDFKSPVGGIAGGGGGASTLGVGIKASDELQMISNMAVVVVASARVDVQLLHPEGFVVIDGARP